MGHLILDFSFVIVALAAVIVGVWRGFLLSVLKLCKVFLAIGAAYLLGGMVGNWIGSAMKAPTAHQLMLGRLAGYVTVFVLAFIGLTVLYFFIKKVKKQLTLVNYADRLLGGLLGGMGACILLFLLASVLKFFFESHDFYAQSVIARAFGDCRIGFLNVNEWIRSASVS